MSSCLDSVSSHASFVCELCVYFEKACSGLQDKPGNHHPCSIEITVKGYLHETNSGYTEILIAFEFSGEIII